MKIRLGHVLRAGRFSVTLAVIAVMAFGDFSWLPQPIAEYVDEKRGIQVADAAQVSIDTIVRTEGATYLNSGSQTVFIDDLTGYRFYQDRNGTCVYSKTTDGGASWGTAITVDAQTDCLDIGVWYDRWTPNDQGNFIHIVTMDVSVDDLFYNRLDTSSSDALLMGTAPVDASTNSGNSVATFATGTNYASITKGTDGTLYMAADDTSDSYVVRCPSNCGLTTGWTEAGSRPQDLANDYSILLPLTDNNIMLINRDISLEDIRHKIWVASTSAWSAAWTMIDNNATDNTTYDVGLAATFASSTSAATTTIYLGYTADNAALGTDDDIRLGIYASSTWSTSTPVANSSRGLTGVAIARDDANGNLYLGYTGRTTPGTAGTGNVYWRISTTSPTVWSAEQGPINTAANDIYGLDLNIRDDERFYASWYGLTGTTLFGDTLSNPTPGILVGATSTQIIHARATSTDLYLGGKFSLVEGLTTRDIESVTITESGSIDAQGGLANIRLYHESDTSYPFDCGSETYSGSESLYGTADTDGFSSANGTSTFVETVSIGTSSALCLYPVVDVTNEATDLSTIDIQIADPTIDVTATLSPLIMPTTTVAITGSTTVLNDAISLMHFHWRNDDGTESGATSATAGVEDTNYNAYPVTTRKRLRIEVSNEGSTTTLPQQYRLEYAPKTFICAQETGWVDVGAAGGDWDMSDSTNFTNGDNTTDIALGTNGAVTDSNTTFLSTNGAARDTSSQTGVLTIASTTFAELEYSIIPGAGATAGSAYCFRVTDAGYPLDTYTVYPQATIASDFLITASSTQTATIDVGQADAYVGGQYVLQKQTIGSADVQSITITASGTVDYQNDLDNVELWYDLDTSAPYDCSSESYNGGELQYGTTDADGFSSTGTSTFTETVSLSPTQTMCLYTIFDVSSAASDGELLDIQIGDPQTDIVRSAGTIGPDNTLRIIGITEIVRGVAIQGNYHFRNDNGSETTATSKTSGVENTNLTNFEKGTTTRLRMEVYNAGGTSTAATQFRLEYTNKTGGSCGASNGWTDVGAAGGDWDMHNSANLTEAANTTDVALGANGGVTDSDTTFLSTNAGVKDTSSQVSSLTLASTTFTEFEFSIISSSTLAQENGTYCFRLSDAGTPLLAYTTYPEIAMKTVRDFKVQRGTSLVAAGTLTITAGVDYVAPAASTSAFIRITNSQHTGAGATAGTATQNADDATVYITNPWNVRTSVTFQRQTTAPAGNSRVAWEIVEYVGPAGGDNEFVVRQQQVMTYGTASTSASGTPVTGVVDHDDVAVFITGVWNPDTLATNYDSMLTTATWSSSTQRAGFNRGVTGTDAVRVSYAVIEFTGANWRVQRVEHAYTAVGTVETESITAVNSLSRAFIHTQKRNLSALTSHANFGHEVWLSSVGAVSFQLDGQATTPANHRSVVWVIENTQTKGNPMIVTRSLGTQSGGAAPTASSTDIGTTIDDVTESSIFANNRSSGTGTTFPEPMMMFELISSSTDQYRLWVSNTTDSRAYRVEVVEWPAARREITQNAYQLYVNEDALDPTDPWPVGAVNLGESTAMTGLDQPTSDGSQVRIRMSLTVSGQSSMPPGVDSFALQYGKRTGASCSAITEWQYLGDAASTTAKWRAYNNPSVTDGAPLSTNPPTAGEVNLSVSERGATYEEENNTATTPYMVRSGEDVEFDWSVVNNAADEKASYCFRMVESDGTEFAAYSSTYPTIRTVGYGAESMNWRWYDDSQNETPGTAFAAENTTPINISYDNTVALRVTLRESNGAQGTNVKFKLQFSESPTFDTATDVAATSSCEQFSYWCYATSTAGDNAVITTNVLSDAESCVAGVGRGCGTHNASGTAATTYDQPATSSAEFSFIIRQAGARVNRTYYFRAYDVTNDEAVLTAASESYPSLTTEGASLTLTAESVSSGTTIDGITTDVGTTPTTIPFGAFTGSTTKNAAYRFTVSTDATEGYQLFVFSRQGLLSSQGDEIAPITASNTVPAGWGTACSTSVNGCFGYHASDDTLSGGSTRFSPNDSFAALETTPREVAQSSIPVVNEQVDVLYRVTARTFQEAGQYATNLVYIVVPVF